MFSTWFATLGAALPTAMVGRRRAAVAAAHEFSLDAAPAFEPRAVVPAGSAMARPAAPARARVVDPIDLRVVPFVPSDNGATQRRVHPRVVNPFRAFPKRGVHLFEIMHPRDPRD